MSSVAMNKTRWWSLSSAFSNRNAFTTVLLGDGAGSVGYKHQDIGIATRLLVFGDVTAFATAGTFTVTAYKDGTSSSDDVFSVSFSITGNGAISGSDTTPEASPGPGCGTTADWFVVCVSSGAPTPAYNILWNYVLEGYYVD